MTKIELTTETDLAPELVWAAVTDFTEDRPRLWPGISPSLYKVHSVTAGHADVQEGSKTPIGSIWARETYTWDDSTMEMRGTVAESNLFRPGGTGVMRVERREDGGSVLHESYDRERLGFRGKIFNVLLTPKRASAFFGKGRAQTYDAIRERPPAGTS
jgi:Polyketide cyclase / dehydrase and lipid transport